MIKYAMIPINCKLTKNNEVSVRRVLISYKKKLTYDIPGDNGVQVVYEDTRFLDMDPYFSREKSTTKYSFYDDGYVLLSCNNENSWAAGDLLGQKRPYHYNAPKKPHPYAPAAVEFKTTSDDKARDMFHYRNEIRD